MFVLCVCLQHCNDKSSSCRSEMNILSAWQRGYTGRNVVVTILDDGIERSHPDLAQNYVCAIHPKSPKTDAVQNSKHILQEIYVHVFNCL